MGRTKSLQKCTAVLFCGKPAQQGTTLGMLLPPFLSHFHTCSLTGTLTQGEGWRAVSNRAVKRPWPADRYS